MHDYDLHANDISAVKARVQGAAIDVLGPVTDPRTIHRSKFSMGFVRAVPALRDNASVEQFTEEALHDTELKEFHDTVEITLAPKVDVAYLGRLIGLVDVETKEGRRPSRTDVPEGDPSNTLSSEELMYRVLRPPAFSSGASQKDGVPSSNALSAFRTRPAFATC